MFFGTRVILQLSSDLFHRRSQSVVKLPFIKLKPDLNLTRVLVWHQAFPHHMEFCVNLQCMRLMGPEKISASSYVWDNIKRFSKYFLYIFTVFSLFSLTCITAVQLIEQMLETMTIGCSWDSPKEWKIKARRIFCPADPVIHGSGTAVTSEWSAQYGFF